MRSGREALREVLQREFAVILLDVNMPDIDGFETATLIRQYKRSVDTPIIFITSYADEMQTERGYALGAVDYILSPVVPHILRSKVRVFVRLFAMQRQLRRQADARAAVAAAEAARVAAEDSDRRSAFLASASHVLNSSLQAAVSRRDLARLLVPTLATMAVVVGSDDIDRQPDVVLASDGEVRELPWPALDGSVRVALRRAIKDRTRVNLDEMLLSALEEAVQEPSAAGPATRPRDGRPWQRAAALPLINGDRLLGALFVASDGSDHLVDWRVLDDLAARAAAALENATLYGSLQSEIVERRAAEMELQEAGRRKDEFLAMLSHELRNPLAPVRTALEVIRRIAPPDPKLNRASEIMVRQVQQMTRLIDELLDVARISQGKIVLTREKVDLNAVIAHSVETAQPLIDSRGQTLQVVPLAEPVWLQGDFARLAQILSNLLNNASKYSERGTTVALHASRDGSGAVIRVRDQGIGIDAHLLPRIFDLFTQGARGLDRAQGGLGVGLTLARRLAEMHGGQLQAASEGVGKGSEFTLRLPGVGLITTGEAAPVPHEQSAPPACRVLVVDDNRDAAQSVASFLELSGHEVRTAADGGEALVAAELFAPDVVVLDIGLPVLDGYEVARRLRQTSIGKAALLLALTGYGQREDRQNAEAAGFDHHFVKPADPMVLLNCIDGWLRDRVESAGERSSA
ncbi:response regulator [Rhizobacter sp. J219]|uniref:response regulator n=1 Tax=Rhizobacter sp. J219 TaxID=2898430 RepID=UPI002150C2D7|nr:response regulator [Rhizobacter sp. J219]MCR5885879.1 response regulator [Rhizobacter sp. J219]